MEPEGKLFINQYINHNVPNQMNETHPSGRAKSYAQAHTNLHRIVLGIEVRFDCRYLMGLASIEERPTFRIKLQSAVFPQ